MQGVAVTAGAQAAVQWPGSLVNEEMAQPFFGRRDDSQLENTLSKAAVSAPNRGGSPPVRHQSPSPSQGAGRAVEVSASPESKDQGRHGGQPGRVSSDANGRDVHSSMQASIKHCGRKAPRHALGQGAHNHPGGRIQHPASGGSQSRRHTGWAKILAPVLSWGQVAAAGSGIDRARFADILPRRCP
jgi:hypothetical protein